MSTAYSLDGQPYSSFYDVIGITPQSTFGELKKAYYRRAKTCHPDLNPGDGAKEAEFKVLVRAFDVLSDPEKRRGYDAFLTAEPEPGPRGRATLYLPDSEPIMDTNVDDTLEELVVGNVIPLGATLATLFGDLEQTEQFMLYREGKTLLFQRNARGAYTVLLQAIKLSPDNILYHYYLAQACERLKLYGVAEDHYVRCLRIGRRRHPPLRLQRIRDQLYRLRAKHGGLSGKLLNALTDPPKQLSYDAGDDMIAEMNRAMSRMLPPPPDRKQLGQVERKALPPKEEKKKEEE